MRKVTGISRRNDVPKPKTPSSLTTSINKIVNTSTNTIGRGRGNVRAPQSPVSTGPTSSRQSYMKVVSRTSTRGSTTSPSRGRVILVASRSHSRRRTDGGPTNLPSSVTLTIDQTQVPVQSNSRSSSKFRVSFSLPDFPDDRYINFVTRVLQNDKFLTKVFQNFNWNELLPMRTVCKKWLEVISSEQSIQANTGVITIRGNLEEGMNIFNASPVIWTRFRIHATAIYDMTNSTQHAFWSKHGPKLSYLEIRNNSMTLSGLVEVLSRSFKLEHFSVTWTAEMYSFNSELIKKYFGVHFRNGNFTRMKNLIIENSSYLVDSALWSLLKWCGGPLRSLTLTCPPDRPNQLGRLKPRWSIEPIQNYVTRFGYTGQFKSLDFSNSNLNSDDLIALADTENLLTLTEICLNSCRVSDKSITYFITKKGDIIEKLYLENIRGSTEKIFDGVDLPKLRILSISGAHGYFESINFVKDMHQLNEFYCSDTVWLDFSMLTKPLETICRSEKRLQKIDIGGNAKMCELKKADITIHREWFSSFSGILANLIELDISCWGVFGNNSNFRTICNTMPLLEKLSVKDWTDLSDVGVTGVSREDLEKDTNMANLGVIWAAKETPQFKAREYIGLLKRLNTLDLGGCKQLTDGTIKYGLIHLPNLRKLSIEKTQVSDSGLHLLILISNSLDKISLKGCPKITPKSKNIRREDGRFIFTSTN